MQTASWAMIHGHGVAHAENGWRIRNGSPETACRQKRPVARNGPSPETARRQETHRTGRSWSGRRSRPCPSRGRRRPPSREGSRRPCSTAACRAEARRCTARPPCRMRPWPRRRTARRSRTWQHARSTRGDSGHFMAGQSMIGAWTGLCVSVCVCVCLCVSVCVCVCLCPFVAHPGVSRAMRSFSERARSLRSSPPCAAAKPRGDCGQKTICDAGTLSTIRGDCGHFWRTWTIAKRFCSVGREWAAMQRSIHLHYRFVR